MTGVDWLDVLMIPAGMFLAWDIWWALHSGQSGGIIFLPNFNRSDQRNGFWFMVGLKSIVAALLIGSSAANLIGWLH